MIKRAPTCSLLFLLVLAGDLANAQVNPYLALGDSIPFGLNPTVPIGDILDYHGYPQFVASALNFSLANAACPAETSASFINITAPDGGCHLYRASNGPMFVQYSSLNQSQLRFAVAFLRANPSTHLVTITIGGDDLLLLKDACSSQRNPAGCELQGLAKVLGEYARNLTQIYLAIRFEGRDRGPIVAANYFSPDYNNRLDDLAVVSLNAVTLNVTSAFGGKVADVFSAFQAASVAGGGLPCSPAVGLVFPNPTPPGGCNVHPTVAGHQLIANLVINALK